MDCVQVCVYAKSRLFLSQQSFDFLRGSFPRLKTTVIAASVLQSFCFRTLISWFLLLAGSLNHSFTYSLGPWENISASELVRRSTIGEEVMAPVYGRREFNIRRDLIGHDAPVMLPGMPWSQWVWRWIWWWVWSSCRSLERGRHL